jgi:hypothetical protein
VRIMDKDNTENEWKPDEEDDADSEDYDEESGTPEDEESE